MKKTPLILSSLLTILIVLSLGCSKPKPQEKPPVPVKIQAVAEYTGPDALKYSANILPNKNVILAFKVGGYVQTIPEKRGADGTTRDIQEGDFVFKGELLARLRPSDYQIKMDQANSQIEQAKAGVLAANSQIKQTEAAVDKAQKDYTRATNLFASASLTKPEMDAAQAQWDGAQAKLKEAQAGKSAAESKITGAKALLNEAKLAYQDSELRAPITGVILKKMVEAGSLVGQGSPGYVIADVSKVKVVFGVPDILVSSMKCGQEQTITTESIPGTEFSGKITRIAPAADEKSRVFDVEISIPNAKNVLKPGMIATVNILTDKIAKPALVIPLTAVVRSPTKPEGYAVYTIKEESGKTVARIRDITLGETYQNNIAVTSGLDFNEKVITAGANIVTEGMAVTVN